MMTAVTTTTTTITSDDDNNSCSQHHQGGQGQGQQWQGHPSNNNSGGSSSSSSRTHVLVYFVLVYLIQCYHTQLFLPLCIIVMVQQSLNSIFWFPSFKTSSIAKNASVCLLRETFNLLRKLSMASSSLSDFILILNGSSSRGHLLMCCKAGSKFVHKVLVTLSPKRWGVLKAFSVLPE